MYLIKDMKKSIEKPLSIKFFNGIFPFAIFFTTNIFVCQDVFYENS